MKTIKKMMALVIAMVMVLGMSTMAMADVTITVNRDSTYKTGATGDREYTYKQIFHATKTGTSTTSGGGYDADGTPGTTTVTPSTGVGYSYYLLSGETTQINALGSWDSSTNTWTKKAASGEDTTGNLWFKLTPSADGSRYIVEWDNTKNDTDTVQAAAKWLDSNYPALTSGSLTGDKASVANENSTQWAATVSEGYYLLKGSEGQNLIAATTNIAINEKNSYPTIDKKQKDEDHTTYADTKVNVAVGDIIDYQVTVPIPADANQPIAVLDKMTSGLTYNSDLSVTIDGTAYTAYTALVDGTDDEYDSTITTTNGWQIKFPVETVVGNQGKNIVITFTATVNSAALTDTGRENEVTLKYNNQHYVMKDKVEYTTYFTGIEKVDGTDNNIKLDGVKFTLTEKKGSDAAVAFNVTPVYNTAGDATSGIAYYIPGGSSNEVVTGTDGKIIIRGLDEGATEKTYTLTETETKAGYNLLDAPKDLTLVEDKGTAYTTATFDKVENNQGTVLPSTGGMGTTIFYVGGAILVLLAGILLVSKRRAA